MKQPCYKIKNNIAEASSFHDMISAGYSENQDIHYLLPHEFGRGYWKRTICAEGIDLYLMDVILKEEISMESVTPAGTYDFTFCQGIPECWRAYQTGKQYGLKSGECYIHRNNGIRNICVLQPGQRHYNIRVRLEEDKLWDIIRGFERQIWVKPILDGNVEYLMHDIPPRIRVILQEIESCPYHENFAKIYLNAKVHELLVVYLCEKFSETGHFAATALTYGERHRLLQAKRLIDETIATPPTISEIAKGVFLSETKLKKGFKEAFGSTVYSYIKDRKMDEARSLLEEKRWSVTEVAYRIGYTNLSHFARSFRERFGINPNEYLNKK